MTPDAPQARGRHPGPVITNSRAAASHHEDSAPVGPEPTPGDKERAQLRARLRHLARSSGRRLLTLDDERRHADRRRAGELHRDRDLAVGG